nr:PREDICTED: periodic tryptophan protein 1 homolog [Bemisia tabaci]
MEGANINVITSVKWVQRGVAKADPYKLKLSTDEIKEIIEENIKHKKDAIKKFKSKSENSDEDDVEACMDDYDEEDDAVIGLDDIATVGEDSATTSSYALDLNDNSDSEKEDEVIRPDDNLLLVGHVDNDFNSLEVWVHNEENQDFYIHHDVLIPSFPLCLEWLNHDVTTGTAGNLCAVGAIDPIITVWDIDIMNCLEPAFKLGKVKKKSGERIGHSDAVLDLAWNTEYEHILASGSADKSVILWDLDSLKPSTCMLEAGKRVESVEWKPDDPHSLLVGSRDRCARLYDCRTEGVITPFNVKGKVEKVCWNPKNTSLFYIGTENGKLYGFDIRSSERMWHLKAHDEDITGLLAHKSYSETLISCSMDGSIKYWDDKGPPEMTYSRDPIVGKIQCLAFNPDNPDFIAVGGTNKSHNLRVLNVKPLPKVIIENDLQPSKEIPRTSSESKSRSESRGRPNFKSRPDFKNRSKFRKNSASNQRSSKDRQGFKGKKGFRNKNNAKS